MHRILLRQGLVREEDSHAPAQQRFQREAPNQLWQMDCWLDEFRQEYNQLRPHEALGGQTPAWVWHPSARRYDPHPPEWDYGAGAEVQRLGRQGQLKLQGRWWQISEALAREPVRLVRVAERVLEPAIHFGGALVAAFNL